jgi:hypothetical protein
VAGADRDGLPAHPETERRAVRQVHPPERKAPSISTRLTDAIGRSIVGEHATTLGEPARSGG